jgi:hypothetical protein
LVANGKVQTVGSAELRWILAASFVTKHVMNTGTAWRPVLKVEHREVNPSETAVRAMLTKDAREGGLRGRLPRLQIETPRQEAAPVEEPTPVVMDGSKEALEYAAGRKTAARFASNAEQTRLEMAQGAAVSARYAGRQAPVETPVIEEVHPVFIDKTVDPAGPQA